MQHQLDSCATARSFSGTENRSGRCRPAVGWGSLIIALLAVGVGLLTINSVPTPPFAMYKSASVTFDPYTVVQTYTVYNRNYYDLKLSNFDVSVATDSADGACTSGVGKLDDADGTFVVPAHSSKDFNLVYTYNITGNQQLSLYDQCKSAEGISYTTRGVVDMKFVLGNYEGVGFGPWSHTYHCGRE